MNKIFTTLKFIAIAMVSGFVFQSCEIINPPEQIPFYLRIDSTSFLDSSDVPPRYTKRGVQDITDAWVSVDGEYIGTYEIPTTIPVMKEAGTHRIEIIPGILANGQNNDRRIYPFFSPYYQTIQTTEGSVDTIYSKFAYRTNQPKYPPEGVGQFPEGFEGAGTIFKTAGSSKIDTIIRTSDPALVFDGNFSLKFELDPSKDYVEFETSKSYSLPVASGLNIYTELNFRTDVQLLVGVYAENVLSGQIINIPYINLNPTQDQWKKIYIDLTQDLSGFRTHRFKLYFKASHNPSLSSSKILLDNIKLIHL